MRICDVRKDSCTGGDEMLKGDIIKVDDLKADWLGPRTIVITLDTGYRILLNMSEAEEIMRAMQGYVI